jgi:hypothetical protein
MILSKAEMEDIWYNKPVGYLQTLKKKLAKSKKYKVTLEPYTKIRHKCVTVEIISTSRELAAEQAKRDLTEKLNKNGITVDGFYQTVSEA